MYKVVGLEVVKIISGEADVLPLNYSRPNKSITNKIDQSALSNLLFIRTLCPPENDANWLPHLAGSGHLIPAAVKIAIEKPRSPSCFNGISEN
jgi:hypothetical protein